MTPDGREGQEASSYKIVKASNGSLVEATARPFASQVSAFILQKMKDTAEAHLGQKVEQRSSRFPPISTTATSGPPRMPRKIGASSAAHINEPTAAALA